MEKSKELRQAKISFNKADNGYLTPRVTLPINWIKEMGLDLDDREVSLEFDGKEIKIRRKD